MERSLIAEAKRAGDMGVVSADMVAVETALEVEALLLLMSSSNNKELVRSDGFIRENV